MSTGQTPSYHTSEDEQILHKLGYAQELFRAVGGFQNFAISFTIISILAGCLTSYSIAYLQGGPIAVSWGWLLVGLMSSLVALSHGGDRVGVSHCRRPLLLVVEAREPGLGLVHRLVQPRRPDRGHGVDRVRPRDLFDRTSQLLVRLPEHEGVRLPLIRGRADSGPRDQPVQGQLHGNAEHHLRLLAHDRRRRGRRRPDHRSRHPPLIQFGLHRHGQRDRLGQWHDVGLHLLLRLPHRPTDVPVHDHGLRRLCSRRRGDAQCVAGGSGRHVHVGRGVGLLRLHPARSRHQSVARRTTARPLHHSGGLGWSDGSELGDVPLVHLLRRTDVLPDRVGDLRVSDAVRVLARPRGPGAPALASCRSETASRTSRSSRSAFWQLRSCCQRSTTSSSATTWAPG